MKRTSEGQRKLKKKGSAWESNVEKENATIYELGEALSFRSHDAMRVIPKKGLIRIGKSAPDFHGVLTGGRAFMFDAKLTAKPKFGLPDPRKPTKGWWHQVETLSKFTAFGGVGFLYVLLDDENPFMRRRFVLPVRDLTVCGLDLRVDRSILLTQHRLALEVPRGARWFDVVADRIGEWTAER